MTQPARLFVASGAVLQGATRAFWTVLAVRVVTDLQLDPLELTLLGTALELSILIAEVPTGVVADLVSRRLSIIVSFVVIGPAIVVSGVVESFWLLAATQAAWGIGYTFQSGADVAWITDELDDPATVDQLLITRAKLRMVATIIGVVAATGLAVVTHPFDRDRRLGGRAHGLGPRARRHHARAGVHPRRRRIGRRVHQGVAAGRAAHTPHPVLRTLAIAVFLGGIAAEAIDRLGVARLVEVGIPEDVDEVVLVAALTLVQALAAIVLVRRVERRAEHTTVPQALGALFLATAVAIAVVAGVSVLGVVLVAMVGKEAFMLGTEPLITTIANSHEESVARATVLSFIGQANAAGEITGGIALGALASATSLSTAFVVSAALFAGAGLVTFSTGRFDP